MSTSSSSTASSSTTLYESESKSLLLHGNISPIIETSSTATLESTTAQVSSKSSSPNYVLNCKESSLFQFTLSPLSPAYALSSNVQLSPALNSSTSNLSTSHFSSSLFSAGLVQSLKKEQRNNFSGLTFEIDKDSYINVNMLVTTGTSTSIGQQTPPTTANTSNASSAANTSKSPAPAGSSTSSLSSDVLIGSHMSNSISNMKCEPHLSTSPTGGVMSAENANSHRQMDDAINKTSSADTATHRSDNIQRKNSNNSNISSGSGVHISPISSKNNENSNSSNTVISQILDTDGGQQQTQDLIISGASKAVPKICGVDDSNEDTANVNAVSSGSFSNVCTSKDNSSSSTSSRSSSSSVASIKDDPEIQSVLNNIGSVKKEQGSIDTPEMSPDGFGSLSSLSGNAAGPVVTSTNLSDLLRNAGNDNNLLSGSSSNSTNNKQPNTSVVGGPTGSGCINSLLNEGSSNVQQSITNNNYSSNANIMPNSMDYMQQQNHIFVFSTQLANKGAESVLSGQFPTIIAYHCTQPATKKFLEDFFLKNPMKVAKMQRQNSFNMAISVSTAHQWMGGGCPNPAKHLQKTISRNNASSASIANNQISNSGIDDKSTSSLTISSNASFPEGNDSLQGETDLMNWEHTNVGLDNRNNSSAGHAIKIMEGTENVVDSPHNATSCGSTFTSNKPIGIGGSTTPLSPGDNMQPSLQGVKVPDENLTPQQRQHREEQLAKIKKMNQFLFPEHGSDLIPDNNALQGSNHIVSNNLIGILGDTSGNSPGGNPITNSREINNIIGVGRSSSAIGRNSMNLPDDGAIPAGLLSGPGDINNLHCGNQGTVANNSMLNNQQQSSTSGLLGSIDPNTHMSGVGNGHGGLLNHGNIMGNNINSMNNCNSSTSTGAMQMQSGSQKGVGNHNPLDMGGPSQAEWSKMHQQFYDERNKCNKTTPDIMTGISGLCRSISSVSGGSYTRSSQPGSGNPSTLIAGGPSGRTQGPPPPYHPTQRSASVPIATQSPNPSSPNNPTSNLSLPSPRTASGTCSTTLSSPISDVHVSASLAVTTTSASTVTAAATTSSSNHKTFQQDDSPANSNTINISNNNCRNNLNQFNSNPSTPISNMSPKDLENLTSTGDLKNARPSPQRSRTPHAAGGSNSEPTNKESRYLVTSPGLNFTSSMHNQGGGPKLTSGPNDNQNSGQTIFGRRPDNLPLNPNSSRPPPIKQNHHFDPISSLAQMSQQLTSCVSTNGGVNGPSSVGITSSMSTEMAIGGEGHQNIDGLLGPGGPMDGSTDHCNNVPGNASGLALPPHMLSGGGQYVGGGCNMGGGAIINTMGPRLITSKIGGGFGPGTGNMMDSPAGFNGGMPPHRMMGGRVGLNFCPFNGSPSIQVKASTPNTIQYMPVRPQTSNTNPRVPPSVEFLHRFTNPNIGEGPMICSIAGSNTDPNKIANNGGNSNMQGMGMNFFQNCNQVGLGSGSSNVNGGNQVDMGGGMLPNHSDMGVVMNIAGNQSGGTNIRAMRPLRQGSMGPGSSPVGNVHRMQGPGSHILGGAGTMNQYGSNTHEAMECINSDHNVMFGNTPGGPNQMFGSHQKGNSISGQSHCPNMPTSNVCINGPSGIGSNEQHSSMQSQMNGAGMMAPNGSVISGAVVSGNGPVPGSISSSQNNGPGNYKSYMGPSTNDLKYAQQYHNFQQQLYATSTRSQVNQQMGGSPVMGLPGNGINSGIPNITNPGFFVNK